MRFSIIIIHCIVKIVPERTLVEMVNRLARLKFEFHLLRIDCRDPRLETVCDERIQEKVVVIIAEGRVRVSVPENPAFVGDNGPVEVTPCTESECATACKNGVAEIRFILRQYLPSARRRAGAIVKV